MSMMSYGREYPFGEFESTVLAVSPCHPLAQPQPTRLRARGRSRESLNAAQVPFSSSPNTGVLSTHPAQIKALSSCFLHGSHKMWFSFFLTLQVWGFFNVFRHGRELCVSMYYLFAPVPLTKLLLIFPHWLVSVVNTFLFLRNLT